MASIVIGIAPMEAPRLDLTERWRLASERARFADVQVRQLAGSGQWIVTSASDPTVAYETDGVTCNCAAALLGGDPVCLHRAALRNHLAPPDPEPPAHTAYDPQAEALQWAYNDRDRAYRDLERYTAKIERGEVLSDREFLAFEFAQQRELDAHNRIVAIKAAQKVQVAAVNVIIQHTPEHTTSDGLTATYALCRDCLTGNRAAMFQIVQLGEGVVQYRTMDQRTMPPDFTFRDAISLAMVYETKRRATRPPIGNRQPSPVPPEPHRIGRHIRPMHLPPNRGYQRPPESARSMRRLLCAKLRQRTERKAIA